MAKKQLEKKALKKGQARFNLVGEAKLNNYTFKLNQESSKSDWIYSTMNLGVDCGDGNVVYAELMGGYGAERDNVIYVHGKKPQIDNETKEARKDSKGNVMYTDDFDEQFTIAWEDRLDKDILDTIGDLCFITVGVEQIETDKKDKDGNPVMQTVYEKFLSAYDAIEYASEHLEDGMVINVSGNLKYQSYQDNVSIKKEITSIALSKATPDKYKSSFQQTLLLNKDSIGKYDKETNSFPIYARVIDYLKITRDNKVVFKGNAPFDVTFEVELDSEKPEATKAFLDRVLKVKKDINEIAVEGTIVEGSSLVDIQDSDLDEGILALIELGVIDRADVVSKQAVGGGKRVRRWFIKKPVIKLGKDGQVVVVKTEGQYTENDLDVIPYETVEDEEVPFDENTTESVEETEEDDDMSWLSAIGADDEELPFN